MQKSTTEATPDEIVYRTDARGRLIYVSGTWDAFAAANDAPELLASSVLGRPLRDFIADAETRHILDLLVQRATGAQEGITVSFRCDAPGERRRLQLSVIPLVDGGIEFRTHPQLVEGRGAARLLDRRIARTTELLTMCSWCNRVRVDEGWYEVEVAVDRLGLFESPELPRLTHGICQDCVEQVALL